MYLHILTVSIKTLLVPLCMFACVIYADTCIGVYIYVLSCATVFILINGAAIGSSHNTIRFTIYIFITILLFNEKFNHGSI